MRRLVGASLMGLALAVAPAATFAQQPQAPAAPADASNETRSVTPTASGTTGIWFVPSGSVLRDGEWAAALYRTNYDDGQGFSDISSFPVSFAYGLGGRTELFGSLHLATRIDRDTRPLFFEDSEDGTGGGIVVNHPLVKSEWSGSNFGDLFVGGKFRVTPEGPTALGLRGILKLPTGDEDSGASSGKMDFQVDAIVSHINPAVEVSGYGGIIMRGNPDGYELTNGLRWGLGAAFPYRYSAGFRFTAELFGERYFDDTLTAPANLTGTDGSIVPITTNISSPTIASVGVTWFAPRGFFIGAAGSWNIGMSGRSDAPGSFEDTSKDDKGLQVRIGWRPGGSSSSARVAPPVAPAAPVAPPVAPAAPVAPPAPAPQANRPPTVRAACDPCEVEVGRTSTITADGQDPDGDPLTYQWKTAAGTVANASNRQTPWTAPAQPGPVVVTVTVSDGRGGTATSSVTINVIQPRAYVFEDVHFEFDRFNIRPDALAILDDAVKAMQANPAVRLTIEGHTCNIGTAEYNLALGERRATAVRDYLASRGITADRLQTVSFGEERPRHDNTREETRRLNRRAALTVRLQ